MDGWMDPEGPTYTTIMELGPQNQNRDGFLGPNSIGSVYGPFGGWLDGWIYCSFLCHWTMEPEKPEELFPAADFTPTLRARLGG